jgi:hypothetical protein
VITRILDQAGDAAGHPLKAARGIALDAEGIVYVTGMGTHNAFRVIPPGPHRDALLEAERAGAKTPAPK